MTPSVTSSWKARRTVWRPSPVAVTISASVGSRCPAAYRPAAIAWRRSAATRRYALTWPGPTARNEVRTALASTGRLLLAVVIPGRVVPGRVVPGRVVPGRVVPGRVGARLRGALWRDLFRRPYCDRSGSPSRPRPGTPNVGQPRPSPASRGSLTGVAPAGLLEQRADLAGLIGRSPGTQRPAGMEVGGGDGVAGNIRAGRPGRGGPPGGVRARAGQAAADGLRRG